MPRSSVDASAHSSCDRSSWSQKRRSHPQSSRRGGHPLPLPPHKPIVPDHIRQACDLFLDDWTCDAEPEIREFLTWVPPDEQRDLFIRLLDVELEVLQRRQALPIMSRYLRRYPEYIPEVLQAYQQRKAKSPSAPPKAPDVPPKRVKLVTLCILGGPHRGPSFSFAPGAVLRLGRGHHAQMRFRGDARMSRLHMQLRVSAAGVEVMDLESRHGTFVNSRRVASESLHDGDILSLGGTEIQVHIDSIPAPARG